jgi:glycosyltransferase involved in cell wall biosynthesis
MFSPIRPMSSTLPPALKDFRISVIIPVYNGAEYLDEALESIRQQTLPVAETIVVDDGSTDASAEIAARHSFVTLVRHKHSGICRTLNRGVDEASGEFLAFLDQDDRWMPQKNRRQLDALKANPELDYVFGLVRRFRSGAPGTRAGEATIDILNGVSKQCLLIRRASFDRVGPFCHEAGSDFLDWFCRARENGLRGDMLPEIVAERRVHSSNYVLKNTARVRRGYLTTLKASLDRRRALETVRPA